ncbi:MAG: phosphatidylserine synthase [Flavobacteriales bacterium CG_4_9_14_0_2_um_filter_35_242]|nr:phosphatidylserine synthase [Zetaproteobacteria bacterium]OIO11488.1 MAG: phosphatidylserine synthase [Flavobacteriaceae bacterium CG1_02_35_72]PIV18710.1 MAG: phosphatidylserine synthase [Flavobacteriales bacterium CG03_land_8_20_14_0_80_35_15]PIX07007.1 MAG: phosphatidylserine synthase [Flavobacteriales bacterium CG_4_8_14_3_um_filter_35_10]PJA06877.1 MAG: phosphatidylserine synthase [Flavobacteriales bacterium CG_4_10_14_0_2_um_filter_35_18]PJC60756.1 MAG: phosphatidylserine synthase [Fl
MTFKQYLPNALTLLNLLCGVIAVLFAAINQLEVAAYFVFGGIFFDYFDGFTARLLKVQGELGKQLDSLADVITSGVVPGIVMFQLIRQSLGQWTEPIWFTSVDKLNWLPFLGLIIPLASAYRLANFNIDTRQTSSFIGLPTPALSIFVLSLPLIIGQESSPLIESIFKNSITLILITLIGSYLLNAELPMFALKFKTYQLKENLLKYIFLILSLLLLVGFHYTAIPLILILYIALSVIEAIRAK